MLGVEAIIVTNETILRRIRQLAWNGLMEACII